MPVSTLSAAIDELIGDGPEACADAESMVSLRREFARLEAVITRATARFDADRTWENVERAVFAPDNRIEVSHRARLFTGATRRALEIRDRACTHKTCDCPAELCQGDHIIPYAAEGPTTQENGQLQCSFHNRLRTKGGP